MVNFAQTLEARPGETVIRITENERGNAGGVKRNSGVHYAGSGVEQMGYPRNAEASMAEYCDTIIVMIGYAVESALSGITAGS